MSPCSEDSSEYCTLEAAEGMRFGSGCSSLFLQTNRVCQCRSHKVSIEVVVAGISAVRHD